jgi:hypothetical protein
MKKLLIMLFIMLGMVYAQQPTEVIPYRLVPSQNPNYGCWLDLEIIALPYGVMRGSDAETKILDAIVLKEIGHVDGEGFGFLMINNKQYQLMKIQIPEPFELQLSRDWDEEFK